MTLRARKGPGLYAGCLLGLLLSFRSAMATDAPSPDSTKYPVGPISSNNPETPNARISSLAASIALDYFKSNSDASKLSGYQFTNAAGKKVPIDTTTTFGTLVLNDVNNLIAAKAAAVPEDLYSDLLGIPASPTVALPSSAPAVKPAAATAAPTGNSALDAALAPTLNSEIQAIAKAIGIGKLPSGAQYSYVAIHNKPQLNQEIDRELSLDSKGAFQRGTPTASYVEAQVAAQLTPAAAAPPALPPPVFPTRVTPIVVAQAGIDEGNLKNLDATLADAISNLEAAPATSPAAPGPLPAATAPVAPASPPSSSPNPAPAPTGGGGSANSTVLSSAKIQVGSNLKLVTATLFQGRSYLFGSTINSEVTSSLPAAIPNEQSSTEYGDAEIETPDGGLLNLRIGIFSNIFNNTGAGFLSNVVCADCRPADYFQPGSGVTLYGDRSGGYDRYYFAGGDTIDGKPSSALDISDGKILFYLRDGVDAKMIYRGSHATLASGASSITPSSSIGDYGAASGYYLGLGFDGGLYGPTQTLTGTSTPAGTFRAEGLATWQYTDKDSIKSLYPNSAHPKYSALAAGGQFVLNITNNLAFNLTLMWPLGPSNRYMGKSLLGGFSISSNASATSPTASTAP